MNFQDFFRQYLLVYSHSRRGMRIYRSLVIGISGLSAFAIWSFAAPGQDFEQMAFALAAIITAVFLTHKTSSRVPPIQDVKLMLEMKYPETTISALRLANLPIADQILDQQWQEVFQQELKFFRKSEFKRALGWYSTLIVPLFLSLGLLTSARPTLGTVLGEMRDLVSRMTRGVQLRVVQGAVTKTSDSFVKLSLAQPLEVDLLAQNLVEIKETGLEKSPPVVELRRPKNSELKAAGSPASASDVFQAFQMLPLRSGGAVSPDGESSEREYGISIAVSEDAELFIPSISKTEPFARFHVKQLPIPKVALKPVQTLTDPWPDDQPLMLQITVAAENPIAAVTLLIKTGERTSRETVNTVVAGDKKDLNTEYKLMLETYVESDVAEVEVVAEAIDRAVPTPLVGRSQPLHINTASAYGRYRQTLQTLKELKVQIDSAVEHRKTTLDQEAKNLAVSANQKAGDSPYFDGLDRVQIDKFEQVAKSLADTEKSSSKTPKLESESMLDLSQSLNQFLFEHEALDDRERDRDFFVAVRGLSRVLEQDPAQRGLTVADVAGRIKKYLDTRQERWKKRVERLSADSKPARASDILNKKPFHAAMSHIVSLEEHRTSTSQTEALSTLSKTAVDYRTWIEELEAKEDQQRAKEESQRQQGLASAKDELRELQKRQGQVSADLDRATEHGAAIERGWPATRMAENANIKGAQALEGKFRALAPGAGNRIQGAIEAMNLTVGSGNKADYVNAESAADMAGRLLRQAEQSASQAQQRRQDRGRRRRLGGDNYYGQSIVGGDVEIKREYQVDKRYREAILDEVRATAGSEQENEQLLEDYLRQVVR